MECNCQVESSPLPVVQTPTGCVMECNCQVESSPLPVVQTPTGCVMECNCQVESSPLPVVQTPTGCVVDLRSIPISYPLVESSKNIFSVDVTIKYVLRVGNTSETVIYRQP